MSIDGCFENLAFYQLYVKFQIRHEGKTLRGLFFSHSSCIYCIEAKQPLKRWFDILRKNVLLYFRCYKQRWLVSRVTWSSRRSTLLSWFHVLVLWPKAWYLFCFILHKHSQGSRNKCNLKSSPLINGLSSLIIFALSKRLCILTYWSRWSIYIFSAQYFTSSLRQANWMNWMIMQRTQSFFENSFSALRLVILLLTSTLLLRRYKSPSCWFQAKASVVRNCQLKCPIDAFCSFPW